MDGINTVITEVDHIFQDPQIWEIWVDMKSGVLVNPVVSMRKVTGDRFIANASFVCVMNKGLIIFFAPLSSIISIDSAQK